MQAECAQAIVIACIFSVRSTRLSRGCGRYWANGGALGIAGGARTYLLAFAREGLRVTPSGTLSGYGSEIYRVRAKLLFTRSVLTRNGVCKCDSANVPECQSI